MIVVKEVKTRRELKRFAEFPNILYRDNPYYVPILLQDAIDSFTPKKNPAYAHCDVACFLAYEGERIVGRVAVILNRLANEVWKQKRVRFSRLDFIDDERVSDALIETVEHWARQHGMEEAHGPIGFCDLDEQGMLVEGFEEMSTFMTLYNYEYYMRHMERLGYAKSVDWVEIRITVPETLDPKIEKASEYIQKKLKLDIIRMKSKRDIKEHLPKIFPLLDAAYRPLYGVVPLSDEQIKFYLKLFYAFIRVQYITLVQDANGELVGFGFALPSFTEAARKSGGKLLPFGFVHLLRALYGKNDTLDLQLIAVKPEMQSLGVSAIMMVETCKSAIRNGVRFAETGPSLETNEKMWHQWKRFDSRQHKRRRVWIKNIVE